MYYIDYDIMLMFILEISNLICHSFVTVSLLFYKNKQNRKYKRGKMPADFRIHQIMEIVNAYVAICKLHVLLFFLFFSHNFITRIFHVIEVSMFFYQLIFLNLYVLTTKLHRLLSMHALIRMLFLPYLY